MRAEQRHPANRTDSLIGAGVRVEGNILFSGVLRVQGDLLGEVRCDSDSDAHGMVVVTASGSVKGGIRAPHVRVGGRVDGPLHSSETIEIGPGGHVVGDILYKAIDIQAGGVIEGSLVADDAANDERDGVDGAAAPAGAESGFAPSGAGPAGGRPEARWPGSSKLVGVTLVLLAVAAAMAVWLTGRDPAPLPPPVADVVAKSDAPAKELPAQQSAVPQRGAAQDVASAGDSPQPAPAPGAVADAGNGAADSGAELVPADPGKVVVVQGVNPAKSAGVLLVIGKEPAVLFRKKRQDVSEGKRIDISRGATESIAIGRDDVVRVASGRELQMFYQGRKVTPRTLESGVWMSFVPQASAAAGDRK